MKKYLVAYDIASDRLRLLFAKRLLQAGGQRVQYSVFVVPLEGASAFRKAQQAWMELLQQHPEREASDSLIAVALTSTALQGAFVYPDADLLRLPHESSVVV